MKTVASLGQDFWQVTYATASWTVKRITTDPEDWLIINERKRVIRSDTNVGRILIRWIKRYEEEATL